MVSQIPFNPFPLIFSVMVSVMYQRDYASSNHPFLRRIFSLSMFKMSKIAIFQCEKYI